MQLTEKGNPFFASDPLHTEAGTPYLTGPGIALIAKPAVDLSGTIPFLSGFQGTNFEEYLSDPVSLPDGETLCKFSGQLCYMSLGNKRSWNKDAEGYIAHIKESGHGSVFEHANYSMLWYGVSRSLTHELVRHRAGFGYSQVSQRYVSGKLLRFVERPEYQRSPVLHALFVDRIDRAAHDYEQTAQELLAMQSEGNEILSGERKTDERKKVNQAARSSLPNETETAIVVTANARGWRHMIEMRANGGAEIEIREAAYLSWLCLKEVAPLLFGDYESVVLEDGTRAVQTKTRKV